MIRRLVRQWRREVRGLLRPLVLVSISLAIGVAAVVAVEGVSTDLDHRIRGAAKELLAADLALSSRRPFPVALEDALPAAERADLIELPTMVRAGGRSLLVEIKAVGPGYPFYGELGLEPSRPLAELLAANGAVVAPEALDQLGLEIGDPLEIGNGRFTVTGVVLDEPDRSFRAFSAGPRVLLSTETIETTGLVAFGSRVLYRRLFRVSDLDRAKRELEGRLASSPFVRLESYSEAQPALRQGLQRLARHLGLVALLSLLLGGVGVAATVRTWTERRLDHLAVLEVLGWRPVELLALDVGLLVVLASAGSVLGAALGSLARALVPTLFGDLLPPGEIVWTIGPVARGLLLGLGVSLLFALPAIVATVRVPPLRVLRREAEPVPLPRSLRRLGVAAGLLGLTVLASIQAGSLRLGGLFALGLLAAAGLLTLGANLVRRALASAPALSSVTWRYARADLRHPGSHFAEGTVGLGLGVLALVALATVEARLTARLEAELPENAPTAFLVDVQPDQWVELEDLLHADPAVTGIDSAPVVAARLASIDGVPVEELARDRGRDERWALTREQRLSSRTVLSSDNTVVAGALWSAEASELSVETEFAAELGVDLGSTLGFDVSGVPLELLVTSLREVDWSSFAINFFLLVEPGVLDAAPRQELVAIRVADEASELALQYRITDRFPNVTTVRTRAVLAKLVAVTERLARGIELLGVLVLGAGTVVLFAAAANRALARGREAAVLKTLGWTAGGIARIFALETGLQGLAAGLVGAVGGELLAWSVCRWGLEIEGGLELGVGLAGIAAAVLLGALAGAVGGAPAIWRSPLGMLRREG